MIRTSITQHARERIYERSMLNPDEVKRYIDEKSLPIARDRGAIRRLFYAPEDDTYYVAVQIEDNGRVVTLYDYTQYYRAIPLLAMQTVRDMHKTK